MVYPFRCGISLLYIIVVYHRILSLREIISQIHVFLALNLVKLDQAVTKADEFTNPRIPLPDLEKLCLAIHRVQLVYPTNFTTVFHNITILLH